MKLSYYKKANNTFRETYTLFWGNLSRCNGLLIILNISLFFLTGLISQGYYYTCYSLIGLAVVGFGLLLPTRLVKNISYYLSFLVVEAVSIYFLIASIIYWIGRQTGQG